MFIISGRSGSGKTIAIRALEDHGFYCIDNIPISLLPELVDKTTIDSNQLAIGIDARNLAMEIEHFQDIYDKLKETTLNPTIVYLDADDDTLVKRFSETRRKHPLSQNQVTLIEAIQKEKVILEPISKLAHLLINTSRMNQYALRSEIRSKLLHTNKDNLNVTFVSFGFKHGMPRNLDFMFDVRCLPNPYWEEGIKHFSGQDLPVIEYLEEQADVQEYFWQLKSFLHTWLPRFQTGTRSYVTIGIGCTGGRHRSVFITERLADHFSNLFADTQVRHRDMNGTG
jgi:RNase adapter protein RapZ